MSDRPTIPEIPGVDTSFALEELDDGPTPQPTATSTATRQRLAQGSGDNSPVTARMPGYVPTIDEVRERMGASAAWDMANTEWAQRLDQRMASTEERAEHAEQAAHAGHEECRSVRQRLDRYTKVVYGGAGLIGVGALAVLKLAFGQGAQSEATRRRNEEHVEMRADLRHLKELALPELRALVAANSATISGLRGALEQISRLGAVRLVGPPPQPLTQGEP